MDYKGGNNRKKVDTPKAITVLWRLLFTLFTLWYKSLINRKM